LAGKREEFRKRMEKCAERQVALQKEQQKVCYYYVLFSSLFSKP